LKIENLYVVIYVNSWLNRRSGGEGRELLPTTSWQQFPAVLSALSVEPRARKKDSKKKPIVGIYKSLPDT
jgi:hypothetical protein